MKWIAALGGGAFVLASLVVGLRLLLLARRTREVPETALGLGLTLMGGLGYPLTSVARAAEALSPETRTGLMIAAHLCMVVGVVSIAVFNWRVFRPFDRAGRLGVQAIFLATAACFVAQGISPGYRAGAIEKEGLAIVLINVMMGVTMGWAAYESFAYHAKLRRREAIGLGNPELARRFRLWGTATGTAMVITLYAVALHALGLDPSISPAGGIVIGPLGVVAAWSLAAALRRGSIDPEHLESDPASLEAEQG